MMSSVSAWLLRLWGWKVTGKYPYEVPKLVLIVAPHTSNWDFPLGLLVRSAIKIDAKFVGKHTLFKGVLGFLMKKLNGIPVDRTSRGNFVSATADLFQQLPHLHLVIAPEGTRKKVSQFKTGFYHIAKLAGVPILLCTFDWQKREVFFDPQLFYPGNDEKADMDKLWNYYKGIQGHNPEYGVL
jgi:1-acyl-sn-glycerol-3-phosphate acyltransferase